MSTQLTTINAMFPSKISKIGDDDVQTISARTLHERLGSQRQFANWIKDRIEKFGFVEGEDYVTNDFGTSNKIVNGDNSGKFAAVEYEITLDMAKELGMVEGNSKGREIRQYFIAAEKEMKRLQEIARLKAETALADMKEKYRQLENYNEDWEKSYQDLQIREDTARMDKGTIQLELNEANAKLAKMKKPSADERNEIVRKAGDRTLREYKRYLRTEAKGMATEIKYMRAWLKGMGFGGEPTMNRGLCEISDTIGRLANYNMDTCVPLDDE